MKSHVSLEQNICPICGIVHDTGAILLDRRLRNSLERHTVNGYSPCGECQEHIDEGYVALVGADPEKSKIEAGMVQKMENVYRTGRIAWLRRSVWEEIINLPLPAGPLAFVEDAAIDKLEAMAG